jgi:sortase A
MHGPFYPNRRVPRVLAGITAGILVLAGGALWTISRVSDTSAPAEEAALPAMTPPTSLPPQLEPPASTPPTTGVPAAAAPPAVPAEPAAPISVPANPYAPEPVVRLGTIEIPKLGLVHPMYEGVTLNNIDHGPSHWPGTALPGHNGNVVVAGHRVTHDHPFLHIDQLRNGDTVIFTVDGQRSVYVVTGSQIVTPRDTFIVTQTATPQATLFACHPPHSATYRYVVHLALVGPPLPPAVAA